jgi:hypothetical protein
MLYKQLAPKTYCRVFKGCDYRWGADWWKDLLTACIHHSDLHLTVHWHTQTSVLSLLQSSLADSWQRLLEGDSSAFRVQILFSQPPAQNSFSSDNSTHWVPGWGSIHTTLLVFSPQADFQLNWQLNSFIHQPATSLHSTELLTTGYTSAGVLVI